MAHNAFIMDWAKANQLPRPYLYFTTLHDVYMYLSESVKVHQPDYFKKEIGNSYETFRRKFRKAVPTHLDSFNLTIPSIEHRGVRVIRIWEGTHWKHGKTNF